MDQTKPFTARSISRPYLLSLLVVIIFLGIGPLLLRSIELNYRKSIGSKIFKMHILKNKKEKLKAKIDQQLSKLKSDYILYKESTDSVVFYSNTFQTKIKRNSLQYLKNLENEIGGYIWVEEIINYKGGKNYAIQVYSPNGEKKDGDSISTFEIDEIGNYFYEKELNAIYSDPPQFYSYQWKKVGSGVIAKKIGYSRLFKEFNWIIGSGVFLEEIDHYDDLYREEFDNTTRLDRKVVILCCIVLILIAFLIGYLYNKKIENTLNYYILEVKASKVLLTEQNLQLEKTINKRTKELLDTNKKLIVSRDIAEENSRLKSTFLANMSHEIRTPMNSILGFSELLTIPDNTKDQVTKYVSLITVSGMQLMNIINDILDVSKIESNQLKVLKEPFVLDEALKELFETHATNCIVDFKLDLPVIKTPINLITDKGRFIQIMNNLISNAKKFTKKGSIVISYKIKGEKNKKFVEFMVKDTGIGISKEKHHLLFNPFSQATNTDYKKGNGLGLSISKGLVEILGGKIWFESELNKGASFYFTLPLD